MPPEISSTYPYRHMHQDDLQWLLGQLEAVNEKVTDLFGSDLSAIPEDLDGLNSAYIQVSIELAWRKAECELGTSQIVDAEDTQ